MSKTPFQARNLSTLPGRNAIINGNFDFWQRGSTFTNMSNNQYEADRWRYNASGTGGQTTTRSTDVPTVVQSKFFSRYSSLLTCISANAAPSAGHYAVRTYVMEGQDYAPLHGKKVRIQFWVKATVTGIYTLALQNAGTTRFYNAEYTVNASNVWEKKNIDIVLDTQTGGWATDNTAGLYINFTLFAGSSFRSSIVNTWGDGLLFSSSNQVNAFSAISNIFQLSQVALITSGIEDGVDIPFSRCADSIAQELVMCQRYYEKSYDIDVAPGLADSNNVTRGAGYVLNAATVDAIGCHFITQKRATPTVAFYRPAGTAGSWQFITAPTAPFGNVTGQNIGTRGFEAFTTTASGMTIGQSAVARGHYTADAEL